MSNILNPQKVGLAFGGVLGFFHFVWSVLVALGVAQPLLDMVLRLHMLDFSYTVLPFSVVSAAMLIVMTTLVGFVVGYVFAVIWNSFQK